MEEGRSQSPMTIASGEAESGKRGAKGERGRQMDCPDWSELQAPTAAPPSHAYFLGVHWRAEQQATRIA